MRVPDFSSLAGCALVDVVGNMNSIEAHTNATSSAKFVQQALQTYSPCYQLQEQEQEQEAHSYELMSLAENNNNTYRSFKEFYNNNNNNNNNTFILQEQQQKEYEEADQHDFNTLAENENIATGVENQSAFIADNDVQCLSTTSSLSSISGTSKAYYIRRGIVNPNYPGFQHLAHTLSEHFIVSVPTTDESDFSDNDMDLSTDSCDDLFEQQNSNMDKKLQKMGVSFETALTALTALTASPVDNDKHHKSLEHLERAPDILHNNSLQNSYSKLDYKPDLLYGTKQTEVTESKLETGVVNTPMVDIIGDFEQEVQREFGLLVNGYKNLSVERKSTEHVSIK